MATKSRTKPLFLERKLYRRSRAMDAARVLPVAGFLLLLLPALWRDGQVGVAGAGMYLFSLWALLIGAAVVLTRVLDRPDPPPPLGDAPASMPLAAAPPAAAPPADAPGKADSNRSAP